MTKCVTVAGTWGYHGQTANGEWWQHTSNFWGWLRTHEVYPVGQRPFVWTSSCGGLFTIRKGGRHIDWTAGGEALWNYFESPTHPDCSGYVPYENRRIIAHSHGGQVALYACAVGLKVHTLITVGTPVRSDMLKVAEQARPNIGYWLHVTDASLWRNRMAWMGALFDGHLGVDWNHKLADLNCHTPGIGHSRILYDPRTYNLWAENGWLDILRRV